MKMSISGVVTILWQTPMCKFLFTVSNDISYAFGTEKVIKLYTLHVYE